MLVRNVGKLNMRSRNLLGKSGQALLGFRLEGALQETQEHMQRTASELWYRETNKTALGDGVSARDKTDTEAVDEKRVGWNSHDTGEV